MDQLCSGEAVVSPGIPRRRSSRDFWIVFNGFEVDALQRSSGAPSMLIFWSSSKSRSGEAGSHLDVDEAGCGKVGFHGLIGLSFT